MKRTHTLGYTKTRLASDTMRTTDRAELNARAVKRRGSAVWLSLDGGGGERRVCVCACVFSVILYGIPTDDVDDDAATAVVADSLWYMCYG